MYIIDNIIVPPEFKILTFKCNYQVCKGVCCVAGDLGAPLDHQEVVVIESYRDTILSRLPPASRNHFKTHPFAQKNTTDNTWHTACLDSTNRCIFTRVTDGMVECVLEAIYDPHIQRSLRPLSCQLFPIRIRRCGQFEIMDYERWNECIHAWESKDLLLEFSRKSLVHRFGEDWVSRLFETLDIKTTIHSR